MEVVNARACSTPVCNRAGVSASLFLLDEVENDRDKRRNREVDRPSVVGGVDTFAAPLMIDIVPIVT